MPQEGGSANSFTVLAEKVFSIIQKIVGDIPENEQINARMIRVKTLENVSQEGEEEQIRRQANIDMKQNKKNQELYEVRSFKKHKVKRKKKKKKKKK